MLQSQEMTYLIYVLQYRLHLSEITYTHTDIDTKNNG